MRNARVTLPSPPTQPGSCCAGRRRRAGAFARHCATMADPPWRPCPAPHDHNSHFSARRWSFILRPRRRADLRQPVESQTFWRCVCTHAPPTAIAVTMHISCHFLIRCTSHSQPPETSLNRRPPVCAAGLIPQLHPPGRPGLHLLGSGGRPREYAWMCALPRAHLPTCQPRPARPPHAPARRPRAGTCPAPSAAPEPRVLRRAVRRSTTRSTALTGAAQGPPRAFFWTCVCRSAGPLGPPDVRQRRGGGGRARVFECLGICGGALGCRGALCRVVGPPWAAYSSYFCCNPAGTSS